MHWNAKFLEEINKGFRLARDLRLLHDLAPPMHNANAREFQRDVDSDIVFHGCPPSPDVCGRLSRDPVYNIYRGQATFTYRSVPGPLRHLVTKVAAGNLMAASASPLLATKSTSRASYHVRV